MSHETGDFATHRMDPNQLLLRLTADFGRAMISCRLCDAPILPSAVHAVGAIFGLGDLLTLVENHIQTCSWSLDEVPAPSDRPGDARSTHVFTLSGALQADRV